MISARRVKCDETRPACQRCIRSHKHCKGYSVPPPPSPAELLDVAVVVDGPDAVSRYRRRTSSSSEDYAVRVHREAEPPDWDYLQSIRYCMLA